MGGRQPAFLEARASGLRIVHRVDVDPAWVVQAIARHRENAAHQLERCEAYGPGSSVSRVVLGGRSRELDLAVKWNHWRGWRGALSDLFNGSRATRARLGAERLRAVGIPHPETLALAERRRLGFVMESFILTRFLRDAQPLPAALPEIRRSPDQRRKLAYAVGDVVGMLHAAELDHSDLKHSNFLVTKERRIVLLDLDCLARARRPGWRRRVRALGQLEAFASDLYPWLPRTDRARFLRAYFRHQPELGERRRELVRAVIPWVEHRLDRWARQMPRRRIQYPLAPREEPASPDEPPGPVERVEPA